MTSDPDSVHRRRGRQTNGSRGLVLLGLVLIATLLHPPPAAGQLDDRPRRADTPRSVWHADSIAVELSVPPDSLRLLLPRGWVRRETFRLFHRDTLLVRGVDFLLDPRRGALRLLRRFPEGARLRAEYRAFPVPVRAEVRRRRPVPLRMETPSALEPGVAVRRRDETGTAARFDLSGSKTLAVEVGSTRDLALRQSLDLAVDGRIGRDVRVRAVLTDRRTPLQPEGGSARLTDLDRLLVEVEGPTSRLVLGDIQVALAPTEFLRFDRRLEGARGELTPEAVSLFATGATSSGSYVTREFFGQEGRQGPYVLGSTREAGAGVILAGSERVFLDGILLTRGENADYLIDYAAAELTFTPRRPITSDSEISVEYQISLDRYRRNVYGVGAGWGAGRTSPGSERYRLLFLSEGDDPDRPLFPLTREQEQALRAAGDSLIPELDSGIRFVGLGNGDYDLVTNDSLAVRFFLWTGAEQGSYQVRFDDVGSGRGDYRDTTSVLGERYFVYAGEKRGRYHPGDAVPRPERTRLVVLSASPDLGEAFAFRVEAALSDRDRNTASSRDDGDNRGGAWLLAPQAGPFPLGPARLTLRASLREVQDRFHSFDRLDPAFYAQDWNLEADRLGGGDRRRSLGGEVDVGPILLRATAEDLDNRRDFRGTREVFETRVRSGPLEGSGRRLQARTRDRAGASPAPGERFSDRWGIGWGAEWFALGAAYTAEGSARGREAERQGSRFREGSFRIGSGRRPAGLSASLEWARRVRFRTEEGRERRLDTGDTGRLDLVWTRGGGRSLAAEYVRRELRPKDGGERLESQIGRIRMRERRAGERLLQEGRGELSTSVQGSQEKEIRFVGTGAGHYDSLGTYVGIGDYEIFYRDLADSARVNRLDLSLRTELDLSGRRGERPDDGVSRGLLQRLVRTLRLVHTWSATVETDRSVRAIGRQLFFVLVGDRPLTRVDASMRADASALPGARWLSPRLRWERRRGHRAQIENSAESSRSTLWGLLLRSRPGDRWTADQDLEWDVTEQEIRLTGRGVGRDGWRSLRVRLDTKAEAARRLSLGLLVSTRERARIGAPERATVFEGTPYAVWTPGLRSRLEIRTTRTSVSRRSPSGSLSRSLETPGWDHRITGVFRLREELDLSFWLRDRQPDRGREVRDGRLELRATF